MSCTSATACSAVGSYVDGDPGPRLTFADRWNGQQWSLESTANPSDARTSYLLGLSCASVTSCTAVGFAGNGTSFRSFAEQWDGTSWSLQRTANPAGATFASLTGVSCISGSACTAVGYSSTLATSKTLAERWNGTSWMVQSTT